VSILILLVIVVWISFCNHSKNNKWSLNPIFSVV
jgi:hypothetical protein